MTLLTWVIRVVMVLGNLAFIYFVVSEVRQLFRKEKTEMNRDWIDRWLYDDKAGRYKIGKD